MITRLVYLFMGVAYFVCFKHNWVMQLYWRSMYKSKHRALVKLEKFL